MTIETSSKTTVSRSLLSAVWAIIVLMSTVPEIIWLQFSPAFPPWLVWARMAVLAVLIVVARVWAPMRPLRNFLVILLAYFSLSLLRTRINFTIPALQALFGGTVFDVRMQAEQAGKLVMALAMIGLLFLLGYKRRSFFLTRGNLQAPITPVPLLGFPKPNPWPVFGLQWGTYIALTLGIIMYLGMRPASQTLLRLVPILPSILFYAVLNAFNEEMFIRAPMLATLEPVNGSRQALWVSAFFFGIAHYFGTPGGILGGISSIFMGWILGKAMLETRGLFWAWWIHLLSDIVIFTFLTASLLA